MQGVSPHGGSAGGWDVVSLNLFNASVDGVCTFLSLTYRSLLGRGVIMLSHHTFLFKK